jgi:hypothetical protein
MLHGKGEVRAGDGVVHQSAGDAAVGGSVGGILGVDRCGYWPAVGHVSMFKDLLGVPLLGEVEA